MEIYVYKSGSTEPVGPFTLDEVRQKLKDGVFDGTELACHYGLSDWVPLTDLVEELGPENPPSKIFICHRTDQQWLAKQQLYAALKDKYGEDNLFYFEENVGFGTDYAQAIRDGISDSSVMLVIVGPNWGSGLGKNKQDWVEEEIRLARENNIKIVPLHLEVLQNLHPFPDKEELPDSIDFLSDLFAHKLRARPEEFKIDFETLVKTIDQARAKMQHVAARPQAQTSTCPEPRCPFPKGTFPPSAWALLGDKGTRTRGLYPPDSAEPFRLSRSKLENFLRCPCCFYLDRRLGIAPPFGPAFTINIAVDVLLKREFDKYREAGEAHPIMVESEAGVIPWPGLLEMEDWRNSFRGIAHLHGPTNLELFGAVDDIWINARGELIVVDYKATSKANEIKSPEDIGGWYESYKRQMEIYVWLLRQQAECTVSNDVYWVYANGDKTKESFGGSLEFELTILSDQADDSWVEEALINAHACLQSDVPPDPSPNCDFCKYLGAVSNIGKSQDNENHFSD